MNKRISLLFVLFVLGVMVTSCAKAPPPYDARAIDSSEVDSPSQQETSKPAAGGGKVLNDRQW